MSNTNELEYLSLLRKALTGLPRQDRTGVGTTGLFAAPLRLDMANGFPLLVTKRMYFRIVQQELAWMLSGSTNVKRLQAHGVTIWDEWADENGDLGPVYGHQWRHWEAPWAGTPVDQISHLVTSLRGNPDSRRHLVTAWNPSSVPDCALPPCHVLFQAYSIMPPATLLEKAPRRRLSLVVHQRSADLFLGVPYNIAFYALLLRLLAKVTDHQAAELAFTFGDAHVYTNHRDVARAQLSRTPGASPLLQVSNEVRELEDFIHDPEGTTKLLGYLPQGALVAPVAV